MENTTEDGIRYQVSGKISDQRAETSHLKPDTSHLTTIRVVWPTNYNNKMACSGGFIHLDFAPEKYPLLSQVEKTVIIIETADGSHDPVNVHLIDILPLKGLNEVTTLFTLASHGMEEKEFSDYLFEKHGYDKLSIKGLAIYYYKKVSSL